jgi:hypothetical protein
MGILERQWLLDNYEIILVEMEYHRLHKANFFYPKYLLCNINNSEGRIKIETS